MLAMAEGEWIDLEIGKSILDRWFERDFDLSELEKALRRLIGANLLHARFQGVDTVDVVLDDDELLHISEIRATQFGEIYLKRVPAS